MQNVIIGPYITGKYQRGALILSGGHGPQMSPRGYGPGIEANSACACKKNITSLSEVQSTLPRDNLNAPVDNFL